MQESVSMWNWGHTMFMFSTLIVDKLHFLSFWSQFDGFNPLDFNFIVLVWWFSYSCFQLLMSTIHSFDSHELNLICLLDNPNPHVFYSWCWKFTILILLILIWWSWLMVTMFLISISWSWFMVLINGLDPLELELIFLVDGLVFMFFTFNVENSQFLSFFSWFNGLDWLFQSY